MQALESRIPFSASLPLQPSCPATHREKHRLSFPLAFFQGHAGALARTVPFCPHHTWAPLSAPLRSGCLLLPLLSLTRGERTAGTGTGPGPRPPPSSPASPRCQRGRVRFVYQGDGLRLEQLRPGAPCPAARLHLSQQLLPSPALLLGAVGAAGCRAPSPAAAPASVPPGPAASCAAAPAEAGVDSSCHELRHWGRGGRSLLLREKGQIWGLSGPAEGSRGVPSSRCPPPRPRCRRPHTRPFPQRAVLDFGICSSNCAPMVKKSCRLPLTKEGCRVPCNGRRPVATMCYQMTNLKPFTRTSDTSLTHLL